jgi:hypothetical protein
MGVLVDSSYARSVPLALSLAEASVKIRRGPPDGGDSPDAALAVWAGPPQHAG